MPRLEVMAIVRVVDGITNMSLLTAGVGGTGHADGDHASAAAGCVLVDTGLGEQKTTGLAAVGLTSSPAASSVRPSSLRAMRE
jgi:hypothetical protein